MLPKCDIWGEVDFGRGPVDVRCTELGNHTTHICTIVLNPRVIHVDQAEIISQDEIHNVFKENDDS